MQVSKPAFCSRIATASPPKPLPTTAARVRRPPRVRRSTADISRLELVELLREEQERCALADRRTQGHEGVVELAPRAAAARACAAEAQHLEQRIGIAAADDEGELALALCVALRRQIEREERE